MAEIGFRDSGKMFPGPRVPDRNAAPPSTPPLPDPAAEPASDLPQASVFASDHPGSADALGFEAALRPLAEMIAHSGAETPISAGLLGRAGAGKTAAAHILAGSLAALGTAARAITGSPFLGKILFLHIDAAQLDGDPATALAGALYTGLAAEFPAAAAEAMQSSRDPRIEAREAFERLDAGRRKLEAERSALEEADARRARLTDTILYEAAGSQIDAYANAKRQRIKNSLAAFGVQDDPVLRYKDMVRSVAETGDSGRFGFVLRAFSALKGQTGLLVTAALLLLAGIGLGTAVTEQTTWLGWMRANDGLGAAAAWLETHMNWLLTLRQVMFVGAAFAVAVNIWRALRLIQLVLRGDSLLRADLSARRRDVDGRYAHHVRRMEALAAECDALARRAAQAEQRAGGLPALDAATADASAFSGDPARQQAQRFIASVGAAANKAARLPAGAVKAPQRIVISIDNLDAAPQARARAILHSARGMFAQGYAVLIAADPERYAEDSETKDSCLDWIQIPVQVGEIAAQVDMAALVRSALGGRDGPEPPASAADARLSRLDEPLSEAEKLLLEDLAPIAGHSARSLKRFVNLYRLARCRRESDRGALALLLALDAGGTPAEKAAVEDTLSPLKTSSPLDLSRGGPRLASALSAVKSAQGDIGADTLYKAAAAARMFTFKP
ncbi:hypothetical protein [Methylocapsa palsarum]|uniref:KAP family P-loop domain-containing protein n=1 Tax=Methylocapsa palsarum TaxID=1612308 RepID=A0A1I3WTM5_9HYPH|nr:hypothetical protein [Methylocapsa palsarum]SFK10700.1 hypothetical protein SAMN05444581_102126 [Methylocapsa palsarum]